jgi:hypothetical protein
MIFFKYAPIIKWILFIFLFLSSQQLLAQDKCGTVLYHQIQKERDVNKERENVFEDFIQEKLKEKKANQAFKTQQNLYEIPVVIHIIHNGEAIGEEVNLSEERILSQIKTLNEDYRRLNADTILTPPQYLDVAADTEIEFVLARSDPNGSPTTGIIRIQGAKSGWRISEDEELKRNSYWPAEDYLNIWVTNLASDLLGYSQFPVSDLEGLEFSSNNRLTDGVVIDYLYFGENADIFPRSIGRTTTHEVGHYLGLRHIWGDGACDVDDFCNDTPPARSPNYSCNNERSSCGSRDMFENYMDYTDDQCMNLFTLCQKNRMRIVLENSPRRSSLVTSPGLQSPVLVENDAGIRAILSPLVSSCVNNIVPEIEIINLGSNNINQVQVGLYLENNLIQNLTFNLNLNPLQRQKLTFSELFFNTKGPHDVRFEIFQVNGSTDQNPTNNVLQRNFYIRTEGTLPLFAGFEEFPEDWLVLNPDNRVGWQILNIPGTDNTAALLNFYNYNRGIGELDYLLSPSLDLRELVSISLRFRVAYATFPDVEEDGLIVVVSKDCGNIFPNADVLYRKSGTELATAPPTENPFVPTSRTEWRTETINFSGYIGDPNIQIAFIGQNGHGNNLYIDDVEILIKRRVDLDLNLLAVSAPSIVSCEQNPSPSMQIRNDGRLPVDNFSMVYSVNDGTPSIFQYDQEPILPGELINFNLPSFNLQDGNYNLAIEVTDINGAEDQYPEDNFSSLHFVINNNRDIIPLRETFENFNSLVLSDWTIGNPYGDQTWELYSYNEMDQSQAAYIRNFTYDAPGRKDWLVSPILDFRNAQEASMFFSIAHALNPNYPDILEIRVSTDCGISYPHIVYQKAGESLSTLISYDEWFPTSLTGFRREFVNLYRYVGEENVRIAFIATTGYGNNLFLDNIEFFVSANPEPVVTPFDNFLLFPNPATSQISASFNLAQRQDVTLIMYDNLGRTISEVNFPNTLNQTFEFDLTGLAPGIYYIKFQGIQFNNSKRFILK